MPVSSEFVDVIYATLVCVSTALGGSMGLAIAVVSLVARIALLPLTLRLAYRALEVQAAVKKIEPQLTRLRERYKNDQRRMLEETARLYQANGIKLVDGGSLVGTAIQAPIVLGLFAAIRRGLAAGGRFLWIKDLSRPDAALAWCCALVTALSVTLGPTLPAAQRLPAILVPAVLTVVFLSRVAAGVSVYTLASGLVGLVQAMLVRRRAARLAAA
ncbi:MAG TPA: membrane protein insertase YidC [Vicinamibacteria bacterium]|jgi:YidC/Oxa1 family membrane protein insertase